jgi:hypothetical protein
MFKQMALALVAVAATILLASTGWSQAIFATLTGVVTDATGAVVPQANITLRNATSGDVRNTVADQQGYYTFASVPVGAYNLTVTQAGFQTFEEDGINLGGGESRSVNVPLQVGNTSQTVQVSGGLDLLTPVDSGERAFTLSTQQLQNYVQVGSNAAEYLKIQPGFGIQNGVSNSSNFTGETIGINGNGNAGSQSPLNNAFSYNGLPGNTLDIVSDGAHVSDPGCDCDTPVNPNSDFLQEFKVLASNFSAEDQKGPMVITSVTKAGGANYHGNAFFTARNYNLNSNDAYSNAIGVPKPANVYYYPGASIGGPVVIPHTNFNKNRDKLFFFTGFEYFYQVLDTGNLTATVPTASIIGGDFSPASLSQLGNITASGGPPGTVPASWAGGQMPADLIDPNMQALMKLYPAPNANPNTTGGFNYVKSEIYNQNNLQSMSRVDYSISNNTKVWVRYNYQKETQLFPVQLWAQSIDQVPYPTDIVGKNSSDSIAGTLTHVFSPTLTNETVAAYTLIFFPNVFANPSAVDRKDVGYNSPTLFNNGVAQIPNFGGINGTPSEAALVNNFAGFEVGGPSRGEFANKYMPSGSDTVTKVWRTHTFKTGFFIERVENWQPDSGPTNGTLEFYPANNSQFTYGDAYADMLAGNLTQYTEANFNVAAKEWGWMWEAFVQDAWQLTPKLTIDAGVRLSHFSQWKDGLNNGYAVFIPSQYSPANNGACAVGPTFCGFTWHARDASIPNSGFPTRPLFYQPRLGFAYDLYGSGKTVVRGGWGLFYYKTDVYSAGLSSSAGIIQTSLTPSTIGNHQLLVHQLNTASFTAVPSAPTGVSSTDSEEDNTMAYNLTVSQKTPWSGLLEVAYIGNRSRNLQSTGGAGSNINLVPQGAMFSAANPGTANPNNYRPYLGYGDLNLAVNNLYANYNALQATWAHQSKDTTIQLNWTWSKALGIVGGTSPTINSFGATLNPFNLASNYGTMPGDRRQIFNAVYSIGLPSPLHSGNRFARGAVNGWQLSGITQFQTGANLTGNFGSYNFAMNLNGAILPGTQNIVNPGAANGIPINNQSILGTSSIQLNPMVTCNPKANLAPHQFVNGSCFAAPTVVGQNGPTVLPALYGPAYFNSDLGIFKNFQTSEGTRLQIRAQAQNFLNHPLYSFPNTNNLTLNFFQSTPGGPLTLNNPNFGIAQFKTGHRIVEMVAKFYF